MFWFMSDEPGWEGLKNLSALIPVGDAHLPSEVQDDDGDQLLLEVHRMVMADGLVLSQSSLSVSAALLGGAWHIVVPPNPQKREW